MTANDPRRHAPATARNREPIREVLARVLSSFLPDGARVLEVGAGTGEHAVFFAATFPTLTWQPTDLDSENLASIAAYARGAALPNLREPTLLDVRTLPWPTFEGDPFDVVLSVNMIHIAPWAACQGLMAGAGSAVSDRGLLLLYGAFKIDGQHTAPSNVAFDESLRAMNPCFGVRDLKDVTREAAINGFVLRERVAMPANNLILVFEKTAASPDQVAAG